ncbi:unnamed protein product [Scytosiphon promiscuus]
MGPPPGKDDKRRGDRERPCQPPPPPASWPAAGTVKSASSIHNSRNNRNGTGTDASGRQHIEGSSPPQVADLVPSWSGFEEDFEVELGGRENTTFFVRIAGRKLAATNGVAVVIHGGGFTGMSWAPAAGVMKRDCCVIAPDLRGHGLTTSANADGSTDSNTDAGAGKVALREGVDDGERDAGDRHGRGSGGGGGSRDGQGDLMSLESLAEDVKSLLVEIFTSGVLFRPTLPRRQQQRLPQQSEPLEHQDAELGEPGGAGVGAEEEERTQKNFRAGAVPPNPPSRPPIKEVDDPAASTQEDAAASGAAEGRADEGNGGCAASTPPPPAPLAAAVAGGDGSSGDSSDGNPIRLLLVGHSLGGCIAVRVAGAAEEVKQRCRGKAEVAGVVAVDVVEGTALSALDDMPEILRKIPRSFPSMEEAVAWHVKTGAVRSSSSAHAVVPSRLKRDKDGERVVWRTDLRATARHWRGWFEGMSAAFLELPVPKLLVVAGMDRLDTELTAAHMQGRFQLKLVYGCGHSVQEDQPDETAASIMNFATRNSIIRRGAYDDGGRTGEEEELRLKLARARGQVDQRKR